MNKEFISFVIIGFLMTALNFVLLAFFVEILKVNYILSNIVSYLVAVVISYFVNCIFSFNHSIEKIKDEFIKLIKYLSMKLVLLGLDSIMLYIMVDFLNINLYINKIFLTLFFTLISFFASKKIITDGEK